MDTSKLNIDELKKQLEKLKNFRATGVTDAAKRFFDNDIEKIEKEIEELSQI